MQRYLIAVLDQIFIIRYLVLSSINQFINLLLNIFKILLLILK